jgi:hypothetical protein
MINITLIEDTSEFHDKLSIIHAYSWELHNKWIQSYFQG